MANPKLQIEVDHSRGRAFISEGVMYYSPNCTRQVEVPPRFDGSYRFEKYKAYLNRFQTPAWWTTAYGFLSFVPLLPSFSGAAFGCLRDFSSAIEEKWYPDYEEYALEAGKATQWLELETGLIQIRGKLRQKFLVGAALNPIPPSLLGFRDKFRTRRSAISRVTQSRDWFVIWMALVSFIIAHIEFLEINHAIPDWFQYLVDVGVSQSWLNGLYQSGLCNFTRTSLRVGVFVDWLEKDISRPRLEFFTCFNVPVWYSWTPELGNLVARTPKLASLRPPPEHLQSATTFIYQQPSTFSQFIGAPIPFPSNVSPLATRSPHSDSPAQFPISQSPQSPPQSLVKVDMSQVEILAARFALAKTKPWRPFFQAREVRNLEKAAKETAEARQKRLNRERKPPQTKVEVFVWDWSDEDPLQLVRIRVTTNRERTEALESHSSSQSIYDGWSNEWDLCEYFGVSDNNDDDSVHDEAFERLNDPGDNEAAHAAYIANCMEGPICPLFSSSRAPVDDVDNINPDVDDTNPDPSEVSNKAEAFDILDYLCSHYGFVCPLLPQNPHSVSNQTWDNSMKALGRIAGPNNPPLLEYKESITRFIDHLQTSNGPSRDEFDVFPENRMTINNPQLTDTFKQIGDFFVVETQAFQHSLPWTVALYHLPQALFVFRMLLRKDHSPASVARILLEEGIPFRTLLTLADVGLRSSLSDISAVLVPIRLSDYIFKPSDYEVYIHQRAAILSSPRGRAALLRGGIIGRLAKEHLGIESACLGPSPSVTIHRIGFNIADKFGIQHWDDELTDTEIDLICGLHKCYTGM
jgi:hypothetical protein